MESEEVFFGGRACKGYRTPLLLLVEGDGSPVLGSQRLARGRVHRQRVIGDAVQFDEQSAFQAQQSGGPGIAAAACVAQLQLPGIRGNGAGVIVTVTEAFLEGVGAVLRLAAENVHVQRGQGVLSGRGDAAGGRVKGQPVSESQLYLTPGGGVGNTGRRGFTVNSFTAARGQQESCKKHNHPEVGK